MYMMQRKKKDTTFSSGDDGTSDSLTLSTILLVPEADPGRVATLPFSPAPDLCLTKFEVSACSLSSEITTLETGS